VAKVAEAVKAWSADTHGPKQGIYMLQHK